MLAFTVTWIGVLVALAIIALVIFIVKSIRR